MDKLRRVLVEVTPQVFGELCKSTGEECIFYHIEGIPKDSKFVGCNYDMERQCFYVCFEHESFEEVEIGHKLPIKHIKIKTYYA